MAHHSRNCLIIYTTPTRKYKTQKGKEIPMKNVADLHLWFFKKGDMVTVIQTLPTFYPYLFLYLLPTRP